MVVAKRLVDDYTLTGNNPFVVLVGRIPVFLAEDFLVLECR
jgi:hypothetical protein